MTCPECDKDVYAVVWLGPRLICKACKKKLTKAEEKKLFQELQRFRERCK